MSTAYKCDLCGGFYEPAKGVVSLDVHVMQEDGEHSDTWADVDFCKSCSANVLSLIRPALGGFNP